MFTKLESEKLMKLIIIGNAINSKHNEMYAIYTRVLSESNHLFFI